MRVRALDSNGDWTFGAGQNDYLTANAAVAQTIACRLLSFLGDCFFATNAGIDWFSFLGGSKSQLALELAINATILNTANVTGIIMLSVSYDSVTRAISIAYQASSSFGNVQGVVNQNLGVGPLAPPVNNLLPQFNQSLLNNVSATVITNAIFSSTAFWEVDLQYFVERRDSSSSYVQRGTLVCKFNVANSVWSITDVVLAGNSGPVSGVTFSIDPTSGQVFYASDDMTGSGYVGNLIVNSLQTFTAGI